MLFLFFCLFSCKKQAQYETVQNKIINDKEIIDNYDVREFEHKGHTYMYNTVKAGICAWHAGHCKCNSVKL